MVSNILFSFSLFFACMIVLSRNPLYSMLNLIGVILTVSILLLSLGIEFLVFMYLLIYIGAIAVLFLFILKMLQLDSPASPTNYEETIFNDLLLYLVLIFKLLYSFFFLNFKICSSLMQTYSEFSTVVEEYDIINSSSFIIGDSFVFVSLFIENVFLLIILAFILLFSMIGSVALCFSKDRL